MASLLLTEHIHLHMRLLLFVINVMLLLYLLAAVRKVENEFTRALLKG